MSGKWQERISSEQGDSLIEFAISAVLILMVIFGIMDCSRALYAYHFVSYAAQEGTRYAIVHGATFSGTACTSTSMSNCDATNTNVQSYVQGLAPPGITGTDIAVSTAWPQTTPNCSAGPCTGCTTYKNAAGCMVQVNVAYTFHFVLPFLPTSGLKFSGTSQQVIQE